MSIETSSLIDHAVQWAIAHLGSMAYPFQCLGFVEDAYELGNDIVLDGLASAKEEADAYRAADHGGVPPRGTFVFYDCSGAIGDETRNWGHVGLALDEGQVIHAWGPVRIDDYRAIEGLAGAPGWTAPRYIGWAPLSEILKGMVKAQAGGISNMDTQDLQEKI